MSEPSAEAPPAVCERCQQPNRPTYRFCLSCGHPLGEAPIPKATGQLPDASTAGAGPGVSAVRPVAGGLSPNGQAPASMTLASRQPSPSEPPPPSEEARPLAAMPVIHLGPRESSTPEQTPQPLPFSQPAHTPQLSQASQAQASPGAQNAQLSSPSPNGPSAQASQASTPATHESSSAMPAARASSPSMPAARASSPSMPAARASSPSMPAARASSPSMPAARASPRPRPRRGCRRTRLRPAP